jgi:hypothetical protein
MQLPLSAHTSQPWRIHEIATDFRVEDVWALPTPGDAGDFALLVEGATAMDPAGSGSLPVRSLFALRWKIGALLGWDADGSGVGERVASLRERLPADLRDGPRGPQFAALPFVPLYLTETEFAAEIANKTMHGVMHLSWVADGDERYRGQMAVLVRRNGVFGSLYMAAIAPFRHILVYPPMLREIGRDWRARTGA